MTEAMRQAIRRATAVLLGAAVATRRTTAVLLGAAALSLCAATPEPAQARERSSTLDRQTVVRDRNGFRSGRIDTDPTNGSHVIRDKNGRRVGSEQRTLGGDTILRNERGQAVGRIEGPLPLEGRR
jgi:hypothetical protein